MNSYQKLKQENERLRSDLYELVTNPDSFESAQIMAKYSMIRGIVEMCLSGDPAPCEPRGILELAEKLNTNE